MKQTKEERENEIGTIGMLVIGTRSLCPELRFMQMLTAAGILELSDKKFYEQDEFLVKDPFHMTDDVFAEKILAYGKKLLQEKAESL